MAVQKRLGRGWETTANTGYQRTCPFMKCARLHKEDSEPRLIFLNRFKWMFLVFTHRAGSWSRNGGRGAKLTNMGDHANAGRNMGVCRVLLDPHTPLTCYYICYLSSDKHSLATSNIMGKWDAIEKCYVLEQFFEKGIEEATVVPKQVLQSFFGQNVT